MVGECLGGKRRERPDLNTICPPICQLHIFIANRNQNRHWNRCVLLFSVPFSWMQYLSSASRSLWGIKWQSDDVFGSKRVKGRHHNLLFRPLFVLVWTEKLLSKRSLQLSNTSEATLLHFWSIVTLTAVFPPTRLLSSERKHTWLGSDDDGASDQMSGFAWKSINMMPERWQLSVRYQKRILPLK